MKIVSKKYIAVPPVEKGGYYTVALRQVTHTPTLEGLATLEEAITIAERANAKQRFMEAAIYQALVEGGVDGEVSRIIFSAIFEGLQAI